MGHAPLLLLAGFLLSGLTLAVVSMGELRRTRQLRNRVMSVAVMPAAKLDLPLPSIRMVDSRYSPFQLRFFRLVGFDPDLPEAARILAWPLVAGIAVAVGLFGGSRLVAMLGLPLAVLAGVASACMTSRSLFKWQARRYQDAVFQQLPDALGLMVRAIRAGLPLAEALRGIARESPMPIREEFTRVVGDIAIGRPVDAALMRVHARTKLTEFSFLAVTLGLQSQTGGSLAETLDTLADMVRKRVAMVKRAKALAAEGRMQAGLLTALPFVAAFGMSVIQPFYLRTFIENPTGQRMALLGFGFMALGLLTIRHLIRQAGRD
ncbi:type II secretion system F family protein [Roseomonas sp. SSH11]|uniref:Type II secretion system F family protein n=1 Tax=Pararoseomonas baculiformis TaxID=2820812 RepID=A0ABS4AFI3_9PROT|nr:type II secretion system F family protein [Pararoseomonas baculiformis]MBP0445285.1 type II secretion system F family protein [Pararoseomonas baculiformis]